MKPFFFIIINLLFATPLIQAQPQVHEHLLLRQFKLNAPSTTPVSVFKPMKAILAGRYSKCSVAYFLDKNKKTDNPIQISESYNFDKNGYVCQTNKLIVQLKNKKRDTIRCEFEGQILTVKGDPILWKRVDYLEKTPNYQVDITRDTLANISKITELKGKKTVYNYYCTRQNNLDSFHINTFIDDDFSLFQAVYCQKQGDSLMNLRITPPLSAGLAFANVVYVARDTTVQMFQFKPESTVDIKNNIPSKIWRYNKKRQIVVIIDKSVENEDIRHKFEYYVSGTLRRLTIYRFGNLILEQLFDEKGFLTEESTPEEGARRKYTYDPLTTLLTTAELYMDKKKMGTIQYFFNQ